MPTVKSEQIILPPLNIQHLELSIVGTSPLICHNWSQKAKEEMLAKQMKRAKQAKDAKDPWKDFVDSLYWLSPKPEEPTQEDIDHARFGFPATAFKNAAVSACTQVSGITKVFARGAFHVNLGDELVEIQGNPIMRDDMERVGMGTADIRFRAYFPRWQCTLSIRYNASAISAEQIANLFNTAGFSVGIGDWRTEKDGQCGLFTLITPPAQEEESTDLT